MIEIPIGIFVALLALALPMALLALLWLASIPLSLVFKEKKK